MPGTIQILIKDRLTGRYWSSAGAWVSDARHARHFSKASEAARAIEENLVPARGAAVVWRSGDSGNDFVMWPRDDSAAAGAKASNGR